MNLLKGAECLLQQLGETFFNPARRSSSFLQIRPWGFVQPGKCSPLLSWSFLRARSTNASLGRRIRRSVASVSTTSARETTRCESEPSRWLETAPGRTLWTSTWLKVRGLVCTCAWVSRCKSRCLTKLFDPSGYQNVLFAMIFVPFAIILFICLVVTMLVVLNKKR